MKALETCQRTMTYISVLPAEGKNSKWQKLFFKLLPLIIIIASELLALIWSILYFMRYMSTDLEKCLTTVYQICGLLGFTNSVIVTFFTRHKLLLVFRSLEKIYRGNKERLQYFAEANTRTEWAWGLCMNFTITCAVNGCAIMPAMSVLLLLLQNKPYEFGSVYHTYYMIFPWNRDTVLGYFFEMCYNTEVSFFYLFGASIEMVFFISVCWHHQAFYKIFRHTVRTLSLLKNRRDQMKTLRELVEFQNSVKEWFLETTIFFSPFILVKMLTFMMFLSSCVFQLDLQLHHLGFAILPMIMSCMISLSNLSLYCLFGKLATESFLSMADCLYESNWQDLPVDLQKYLILMIENAQVPLNYHGFGVIYLNLETFTKMLRTVFSYYMMFKAFTQ